MRRIAAIVITSALATGAATGEGLPTPTEHVVDLRINGQAADSALVVLQDPEGALLIRVEDVSRLRLRPDAQDAVSIDGEHYYRIATGQGREVRFDAQRMVVDILLPPAAFEPTEARYVPPTAPDVSPTPHGGFLNYDVSLEQASGSTTAGTLLELGYFGPHGVVTHSTVARDDAGSLRNVRLETTWTRDMPGRAATLRVGDAISAAGSWGRSVRFGGIQFGTNFATQPTLITTPLLAASGEAVLPSTVDIFINGRQVASESVAPGPFSIEGLPAVSGAGQMQVVVTDALGRQQVVAQAYYGGGASLLRDGLQEFSLELGSIRRDYGTRSSGYGDLLAAGTFRRGLTDWFTLEAHGEVQGGGAAAAGLGAAWQAGSVGVLNSVLALGGDAEGTGWQGGLGFERSGQRLGFFAEARYASRDFAQVGDSVLLHAPRLRIVAGAGYDLRRLGTVRALYGRQTFWDAPEAQTLGLTYAVSIGQAGFLSFFASHGLSGDRGTNILLNWTLPLGERRSMTSSLEHAMGDDAGTRTRASVSLQQSLPAGSGTGYYLDASTDDVYRGGYALQGDAGLAEVEYARRGDASAWRATAVGGLAVTGAGVMPARRLDRSFAVVQVADYEGLTVYVDHQPVGRTDRHGRVLVDNLRAYEENQISLDPAQVPMDAALSVASMSLTPAYRSGPLVRFPVERAGAVTLNLLQPDGTPVPAGAMVTVGERRFPVGLDGLLYLERVGEASHGLAQWSGGRCAFTWRHVPTGEPVDDLGNVSCGGAAVGDRP